MFKNDTIFKHKLESYRYNIDPINQYKDIASYFISKTKDIPIDKAKELITNYIKSNKRYNNPIVKFYQRGLNGDIEKKKSTLYDYIKYPKNTNNIMVPSLTVYFNPKVKKSLHSEFIFENVNERNKFKKLALKYQLENNFIEADFYNTVQSRYKIFNNALSGGYGSGSTVLSNPSAHYTLTSITRSLSGIGNTVSEAMISGNHLFKDTNTTINHLATIVKYLDYEKTRQVIKDFNLYLPNNEDLMSYILKSTRKYWKSPKYELEIYKYIKALDAIDKSKIFYHLSFYNLRNKNPLLVKDFFNRVINFPILKMSLEEANEIVDTTEEWIINLAVHIMFKDLMGKDMSKWSDNDRIKIASLILNITKEFLGFKDIFQTFFITDVFPVSIAYVKDMVREAIVLSDTDSTCATYEDWVQWYYGDMVFGYEPIAVSAIVMTIVTQTLDHYIKKFAVNMNIDYEKAKRLKMKNEYTWDVFVNTNVSKHYFAKVRVREGNVFKFNTREKYLEKKGVHLIASTAYEEVRKLSTTMMLDILDTIGNNEKLSITEYIQRVISMEQHIIDKIMSGSPDVLKLEKIKNKESYKLDEYKSPYFNYLFWNKVFGRDYGEAPEPPYVAIKLNVITDSKKKMLEFLESLDNEYRDSYLEIMKQSGKTEIKTYKLPLSIVFEKGIPDILKPIIDTKKIVMDNCKVLYIILESIGVYIPENQILSDIYDFQK